MRKLVLLTLLGMFGTSIMPAHAVSLEVEGLRATMNNGRLQVVFRQDASAEAVTLDGTNLIAGLSGTTGDPSKIRSAYLDYHSGGVKNFVPERLEIIENTPSLVHIAYLSGASGRLALEYHLIMRDGVNGLYSYVIAGNSGSSDVLVSELRNVYRFNAALMGRAFNGVRDEKPPLYGELEKMQKIQDETWALPDGSIYSKYDLAGYLRSTPFWGVYGNGFGAWLIHAGKDYFSGDALKQDLLVHQDAIVLNYMTGAHLGTPDMIAPPGWSKFYGPWLLYFNHQDTSAQALRDDVLRQAREETAEWPYRWVKDARYAPDRGEVKGRLQVADGRRMRVVLSSSRTEPFDLQTLGYLQDTLTDKDGSFDIKAVRPGHYILSAYAIEGSETGVLLQKDVVVNAGRNVFEDLKISAAPPAIWSIGQADRSAAGFRFADALRANHWQHDVPATLDYRIGRSTATQDWYYAQTQPGQWNIHFDLKGDEGPCQLELAIAAASNSGMTRPTSPYLSVSINGKTLAELRYENDKAIYRHALSSGQYHASKLEIPAGLIQPGENTVTLELKGGAIMYDSIALTRSKR